MHTPHYRWPLRRLKEAYIKSPLKKYSYENNTSCPVFSGSKLNLTSVKRPLTIRNSVFAQKPSKRDANFLHYSLVVVLLVD